MLLCTLLFLSDSHRTNVLIYKHVVVSFLTQFQPRTWGIVFTLNNYRRPKHRDKLCHKTKRIGETDSARQQFVQKYKTIVLPLQECGCCGVCNQQPKCCCVNYTDEIDSFVRQQCCLV